MICNSDASKREAENARSQDMFQARTAFLISSGANEISSKFSPTTRLHRGGFTISMLSAMGGGTGDDCLCKKSF